MSERRGTLSPRTCGIIRDGQWKGQRCFVLGGGPSTALLDAGRIPGLLTVGVNATAYLLDTNVGVTSDVALARVFEGETGLRSDPAKEAAQCRGWADYAGVKVYHDITPRGRSWADVRRGFAVHLGTPGRSWGLSLREGLVFAPDSGLAAINLATCLGASPIYLLGFEGGLVGERSHHHDEYVGGPTEAYYSLVRQAHEAHAAAAQRRSEVVNLTPGTLHTAWPKGRLEYVI